MLQRSSISTWQLISRILKLIRFTPTLKMPFSRLFQLSRGAGQRLVKIKLPRLPDKAKTLPYLLLALICCWDFALGCRARAELGFCSGWEGMEPKFLLQSHTQRIHSETLCKTRHGILQAFPLRFGMSEKSPSWISSLTPFSPSSRTEDKGCQVVFLPLLLSFDVLKNIPFHGCLQPLTHRSQTFPCPASVRVVF